MQPWSARPALPATVAAVPAPSVERLAQILRDREGLKNEVWKIFKNVAKGTQHLDVPGLVSFRSSLMQALNLPVEVFGDDVRSDYVRFDFDGNGSLDVNEVYRFVKFSLWEYIKTIGEGALQVNVPRRSLPEAGYSIIRELGKGSQAKVMLCVNNDGEERCVKCYRKGAMTVGGVEQLKEEFEAMRFLGCRSIAQTFEVFQDSSFYYMVNEVYHGGDFTTLRAHAMEQQVVMTEAWWMGLFKQCLRALEHMHQHAVMHCDIKEPNLMLKTQEGLHAPDVVVVDLGVTTAMGAHDTGMVAGTPGYIPPETLRTRKWFPKGDIFSLGVVVFQMLTDTTPDTTAICIGPQPRGLFLERCSSFREVCEATFKRTPQYEKITCTFPRLGSLSEQLLLKDHSLRPRALELLQARGSIRIGNLYRWSLTIHWQPRASRRICLPNGWCIRRCRFHPRIVLLPRILQNTRLLSSDLHSTE
jgi:serine/threonine protein kinase